MCFSCQNGVFPRSHLVMNCRSTHRQDEYPSKKSALLFFFSMRKCKVQGMKRSRNIFTSFKGLNKDLLDVILLELFGLQNTLKYSHILMRMEVFISLDADVGKSRGRREQNIVRRSRILLWLNVYCRKSGHEEVPGVVLQILHKVLQQWMNMLISCYHVLMYSECCSSGKAH